MTHLAGLSLKERSGSVVFLFVRECSILIVAFKDEFSVFVPLFFLPTDLSVYIRGFHVNFSVLVIRYGFAVFFTALVWDFFLLSAAWIEYFHKTFYLAGLVVDDLLESRSISMVFFVNALPLAVVVVFKFLLQ